LLTVAGCADILPVEREASMPRKRIVHVHLLRIRQNAHAEISNRLPPIIVRDGRKRSYANAVDVLGPCRIVYSPDDPLDCGARVWIETEADVAREAGMPGTAGHKIIQVHQRRIRTNIRVPLEDRLPPISVASGGRRRFGNVAEVRGACRIVYDPDGAEEGGRVRIETSAAVALS
jgi:hypothetical protein